MSDKLAELRAEFGIWRIIGEALAFAVVGVVLALGWVAT